jgi:hypothetical protein
MNIPMICTASVVAKNIRTNRLVVAGGIRRTAPAEDGSMHQEYLLTQKGHGLFHVVAGVRQWGQEHFYAKGETRSKGIDRKNKDLVRKLELRARWKTTWCTRHHKTNVRRMSRGFVCSLPAPPRKHRNSQP